MLKHYLVLAWRSFRKHPGYSSINLVGLSIGLICGLLILLYVRHELSYDKFHDQADRIYRITADAKLNDSEFSGASVGYPTGPALKQDYPEVEEFVRFRNRGNFLISIENNHFQEEEVIFVDSTLFDIFSIPLVEGDPQTALVAPNSAVITTELAQKFFGTENAMGQVMKLDNEEDYQVTGIIDPMPNNSHFRFNMFLSLSTIADNEFQAWTNFNLQTYIRLAEGTDPQNLEAKFPDMVAKYIGPEVEQYLGVPLEEVFAQGNRIGFFLQPMLDIHLHSDLLDELGSNSDIRYVIIFSLIGLFILGIACINFMNLATARYANRAREVGIKKSVGAFRSQLVWQFLSESIALSLIATLVAWLVIPLVLPGFNSLAGKELTLMDILQGDFFLLSLGLAFLVGLLAGSYPALFLSGMRPVDILKGNLSTGAKSGRLRSILVVGQFVTTVVLLIGTLVVFDQIDFIQNKKLGFDKENVLVLHDTYLLDNRIDAFKEEMLQNPQFTQATVTGFLPVENFNNSSSYFSGRNPLPENTRIVHNWRVDYEYVPTMGLEILEGRNFSREYGTDSMAILVNESLVKQFGWEDPLSSQLSDFGETAEDIDSYQVIGVFKDFHFNSLRNLVGPMLLHLSGSRSMISFRLLPGSEEAAIQELRNKWAEFLPGYPFEYSFLDDRFDKLYTTELRFGRLFGIFAAIAIVIACLGLLGLSAFAGEQRNKEMSIRKVLGASVQQIMGLMYKEYGSLLIWAFLLGFPLAAYGMYRWLEGFEYRTAIDFWVFAKAGLLVSLVALITLSFQSIRSALSDPVEALKTE